MVKVDAIVASNGLVIKLAQPLFMVWGVWGTATMMVVGSFLDCGYISMMLKSSSTNAYSYSVDLQAIRRVTESRSKVR